MNSYRKLKAEAEADPNVKHLLKTYREKTKQIDQARKRLTDEQESAERLQARIGKLKSLAGESLAGGQGEYEKFKTSLRKRSQELETALSAADTLKKQVIPKLSDELLHTKQVLTHTLLGFFRDRKASVEAAMSKGFEQSVLGPRDEYLAAATQIFKDVGLTMTLGARGPDAIPRLKHDRLDTEDEFLIKD